MVVIVVVVVVRSMVEVDVQLLFLWVDGWSDKTKLILISTLVEVVVKAMVEVELGNIPVFILPLDPTLAPNLQE